MENKSLIYHKLEAFIRKFYTNELLKGLIFFIGLGLLYLLFTLFVEYFLWLKPTGRTILFWLFIAVEVVLLFRFILFPIFKLFKLQKGIDYNDASQIIGSHFPEVDDKLKNFLQLADSEQNSNSELLLASIEQKAKNLNPIPFTNAVNFKSNVKYLPWAAIPVLLILFFLISGNADVITQSFTRVVNYNERYSPPAPFQFQIVNSSLQTEQGNDFTLQVKSVGKVVPENAMILLDGESYFMESTKPGVFEYKFSQPTKNQTFHVEANQVTSKDFTLEVVAVPTISNFQMVLNFPSYLNRKAEVVEGSGNAVVPEGTVVTWNVSALATNEVEWMASEQISKFTKRENSFKIAKRIIQNTDYQILTSNSRLKHHEKLNYQISITKDQYPTISASNAPDSLKLNQNVIIGQVSDDYGLSRLQIVYYPTGKENQAKKVGLPVKRESFDQFVFSFPGNLQLEEGVSYDYYFEVFDNDALHNFKSSKSSVFSDRIATVEERENQSLQQQNDNINSLQKSIKEQDKQHSELDKLQKLGKEKETLEHKDLQKINDFIQRQKQQEQMMKEFSKKLEDNLDKFKTDKKDEQKEELQERLEKAEKEAEKNEKLLEELKKLSEKLKEEELFDKMDKFKQASKNQTKNLEQLVELTKRFYVQKKAEQLAEKLEKLAEKQDKLSQNDQENSAQKQQDVNKEFDQLQKELDQLKKENEELKSPMDVPSDEKTEKSIEQDMQNATENLKKDDKQKAKPKQKSAAQKMKQMSGQMKEMMAGGEMEQLSEDVKMLRQILDNLLAYSFAQEDVMKQFKSQSRGSLSFNKHLKIQQDLKLQFKHVDDSLFAMSLRNPKIAEDVTKEIGNVHYNVDKALETLAEAQISKGVSHQQYAVSSANKLADFLTNILNNMQMQMSGMGMGKPKPGEGQGMQLPDIIQKQQGLGDKMKQGMKDGEGDKPGEKDGDGKDGKSEKSKGQNGSEGNDGEGNAAKILEIYKEQQRLREALQKELEKNGMGGSGQNALNQMKQIEKELLNKGFKNETLQRMLNLKHELLKLDKAIQQQGEDTKRQSQTNKKEYGSQPGEVPAALRQYLNSIEILNRQSLPLRPNYNQKVQEYFKKDD